MDRIILSGIECFAYGGVTDAEQSTGQRYRLDIELEVDLRTPGATDNVNDTIHYGQVHDVAVAVLRERPFRLLEAAAARITDRLLDVFSAESVTVRLSKLLPPIDGVVLSAAVELRRGRYGRSADEQRGVSEPSGDNDENKAHDDQPGR